MKKPPFKKVFVTYESNIQTALGKCGVGSRVFTVKELEAAMKRLRFKINDDKAILVPRWFPKKRIKEFERCGYKIIVENRQ